MYPEAGGSSLFVRRAFNELWSFFTAWAQMLNYVITIAISAFFAAGYFAASRVRRRRCGPARGRSSHRRGDRRRARARSTSAASRSRRHQRRARGRRLPQPARARDRRRVPRPRPGRAGPTTSFFGIAPTWQEFLIAIPVGTVAYTGIETISNMAGEARDEARTIPAAIKRVMIAVFTIYFTLPWIALSALPVALRRGGGELHDAARRRRGGRRLRRQPDARDRERDGPRAAAGGRRALRRRARGDDPGGGHERGRARGVAAGVLDGHPPPDARRAAAPAPALPHAVPRDPHLRGARLRRPAARQGGLPGRDLRVRGDAVASRWRTWPCCGCASSSPTARARTAARAACGSRPRLLPQAHSASAP